MAQFQFDASQHAGAAMNFEALPKGWYQAVIIESKSRTTNSGGQALDFVAEITAPAFAKGRKVFLDYNVVNASEDAVRIGHEQLAALSMACQHPRWSQTEELHNKPFHIKLKIDKAEEGSDYEDRNKANGYDMITVNRALAVQPGSRPAGAAPASAPFPGAAPAMPGVASPAVPAAPTQPAAVPAAPAAAQPAPAAPAQPWQNSPQPWEQPQAAQPAPVTPAPAPQPAPAPAQPVKSPEQIAWEQQQAAAAAQQPAPAPVQQPVPEQPAPVQQPAATPPWATQTAQPAPQQAPAAQAAPAAAEPPHPAQAQLPPWQQPQA
nr:unknown function [Klebsiella phage vB_Ko_K4PH164]